MRRRRVGHTMTQGKDDELDINEFGTGHTIEGQSCRCMYKSV